MRLNTKVPLETKRIMLRCSVFHEPLSTSGGLFGVMAPRCISLVGCHCEGEVGDVVVGGVSDVPGTTLRDKLAYFQAHDDGLRRFLCHEPRGRREMSTNLILPPCDPSADAGLLIMGPGEWTPMSGSNVICSATVLLETGMMPMSEPLSTLVFDTAAGLVGVEAQCEGGKCRAVSFDNVPAFVGALGLKLRVHGYGDVLVDIAWGGAWYVLVDASSVGLRLEPHAEHELVEFGQRVRRAAVDGYTPVHPQNPELCQIQNVSITGPVAEGTHGKHARHTVVLPPGRLDRSPCGTGTSARMAVLHARGQLGVGESFAHESIIGTKFEAHIKGLTKLNDTVAVLPTVKGRAWITGYKKMVLDPTDPYPFGFSLGQSV